MTSARTSLEEVKDLKEIPTRRWSERVSDPSPSSQDTGAASVSAACLPDELPDLLLDRFDVELEGRAVTLAGRWVSGAGETAARRSLC
jgi:hypothetical protein